MEMYLFFFYGHTHTMNCQSLFEKFPRKLHIDSHKDPSTLEIQILGDNVTKGPSPLLTIALLNVHTAITLRAPKPQNPLELQRDQAAQQWTDYTYYTRGDCHLNVLY